MRIRSRLFVIVALGVILAPGAASAARSPVVELLRPDGKTVEIFASGAFAYPANGALVSVGLGRAGRKATVLLDVSLLDGQVTAARVVVPANGFGGAQVVGLAFDGVPVRTHANTIVPIANGTYLVALQEALLGNEVGLVGLRIHLGEAFPGAPAGTDVLVAVPPRRTRAGSGGPVPLLGVASQPAPLVRGSGYVYPLAVRGSVIGCPFAIGSTHSPFVPPNNLASDDAVDIAVPIGTPVLAVTGGTIGALIGPLDTRDPAMAGLRVHLDTPTQHFYYAHLSQLFVHP